MPDQPNQPTSRRRVRLTPVPAGTAGDVAVPVARHILARAASRIGPGGLGDLEARMEESAAERDNQSRGGLSERNRSTARPVRLCTTACEFRVGGGQGCEFFVAAMEADTTIDGEQCQRDLSFITEVEGAFREGDVEKMRAIAGRLSGAVVIEIQKLFDRIITDGACVEEPIFDAEGSPIYAEEIAQDAAGQIVRDSRGDPVRVRRPITRKKEHPLYAKLISLLRETRLIDLQQWQLTPRASGAVAKTDGLILLEESGGGRTTLAAIQGDIRKGMEMLKSAQALARIRRENDPAYRAMRDVLPVGVAATVTGK